MTDSTTPTATITVFLHGATGRMGRAVAALAEQTEGIVIGGALELRGGRPPSTAENHPQVDQIPPHLATSSAVVVDFSQPAAIHSLVGALTGSGVSIVSGTTGLGSGEWDLLEKYSEEAAVFYDENMSYGVSVLKDLAARARVAFGPLADVEIVETHHRGKRDMPSGTALALARAIDAEAGPTTDRKGLPKQNTNSEIPIHSLRVGGVTGEHRVVFATDEESVVLAHRALTRDVFARGALRAARFISTQPKGLYNMSDLVGGQHA